MRQTNLLTQNDSRMGGGEITVVVKYMAHTHTRVMQVHLKIFRTPYTREGGKFFSLPVTSTKVNPGLDPTGELLRRTAGPLGTRPLLGFTLRSPPVMSSDPVLLGT